MSQINAPNLGTYPTSTGVDDTQLDTISEQRGDQPQTPLVPHAAAPTKPVGAKGSVLASQPPHPGDVGAFGPGDLGRARGLKQTLATTLAAGAPLSHAAVYLAADQGITPSGGDASRAAGSANRKVVQKLQANETALSASDSAKSTTTPSLDAQDQAQVQSQAVQFEGMKTGTSFFQKVFCKTQPHTTVADKTGLDTDTSQKALNLMHDANVSQDQQSIGLGLALLAWEKNTASPNYKADLENFKSLVQNLSADNDSDKKGGGPSNTYFSNKLSQDGAALTTFVQTRGVTIDGASAGASQSTAGDWQVVNPYNNNT